MLINAQHHPNRQRYTIAHELGHYFLHRHLQVEFQDRIFFRGAENSKEEVQANSFASEILMPEVDFRRMVREGKNKVNELSQEFGVSTLALRIRAKNLGMSGHGL
jgi:Zn-dependent peptidase ImmA (M78 family)